MQEVILTKGLPGSGKTTFAKGWVAKKPTERVRINKDDLRAMLHEGKYSRGNESQVLRIEEAILIDSLRSGKSVVVDNTHLVPKHFKRLKSTIENSPDLKNIHIKISEKVFDVSPEECIRRDLKRANSVGSNIIWRMYWDHVATIETTEVSPTKHDAVIVDMDGTLCDMTGVRGPFEWNKVHLDKVRKHVRTMAWSLQARGFKLIIVTGRDGCCEEASRDWLIDKGILFDEFFIRPTKDNRPDYIVKREIYEIYIKPKFNVSLVIDDRPQVLREWKRLGLPVVSVNDTDREF